MIEDHNLALFLDLFKGRKDYFAQQTADGYFPVPRPLDESLARMHLEGDISLGIYLLRYDSLCQLICVDIDIPRPELEVVDFKEPGTKLAYLEDKINAVCRTLSELLKIPSEAILVEDTGGRGYHIWVFLSEPMPGGELVRFGVAMKSLLDFDVEFFPKQATLSPQRKFGNLIKLPLGIHQKHGGCSKLLSLTSGGWQLIPDVERNLARLMSIVPVDSAIIREAASTVRETDKQTRIGTYLATLQDADRRLYNGTPAELLCGCRAMRSIRERAGNGLALSHAEARSFANVLLSIPGSESFIHETMRLSLGTGYDSARTAREVERITALLPPNCLTLVRKGICSGYCKKSVQKRNEDPLASNTTPCSVWLRERIIQAPASREDVLARVSAPGNLKRTYHQLKYYHEYEDAVFFDPFDFDRFEEQLDANLEVLVTALGKGMELPSAGFIPVRLPKRVNEDREMEYRVLSYSSVHYQMPIQAVFNIVAPIIEDTFEESSHGYRWNRDSSTPNRIFEDWRTAYPRFRNSVLHTLGRHPDGYYICCDVKGFYDHIKHDILLEQIRQFSLDPYIRELIERAVRSYEAEGSPGCGLPQGPAHSRLLANLYLSEFDKAVGQRARGYFRYVDDLFLVFGSRAEAEKRFTEIQERLQELGLELSESEEKAARIRPNSDLSAVRKALDRIHYGMLEGARHLPYQTLQKVADFSTAIERHGVSPIDLDQLLEMNGKLSSYLYFATHESELPHSLKTKLFEITEFLVEYAWFCPKKLKRIFCLLLELGESSERLHRLFSILDDKHKAYFLLSVYGQWRANGEHEALLRDIQQTAASHSDDLVWGFAVAIQEQLQLSSNDTCSKPPGEALPPAGASYFSYVKWLSSFDYLDQSPDERAVIREVVGADCPEVLKIHLFGSINRMPSSLVDTIYLRNVLSSAGPQLLPAACRLLASATDKCSLLTSLVEFVSGLLEFKEIAISLVRQRILERREIAGVAEIKNLRNLYAEYINDDEMRRAMLGAVSQIEQYGLGQDPEFANLHKEIAWYNGCYLFETRNDSLPYDYLEILPEGALRDHFQGDLDFVRHLVEDFCERGILPPGEFAFDSGRREIRLRFRTRGRFEEVNPQQFTSRDPDCIRQACSLATEVYRKAAYFERTANRSPRICPANLLLDPSSGEAVFRSFGSSLCSAHRFGDETAGEGEPGLAKMVALLLGSLLFEGKDQLSQFLNQKEHTPMEAILAMFLQNMHGTDPSRRYTQSRFRYLVDQLPDAVASGAQNHALRVFFLREKLKGSLYRNNKEVISCHGACKALNEHASVHIRQIFTREKLNSFQFRRRSAFTGQGTRALHRLSRDLFDLSLCRKDIKALENLDPAYADLVEMLLLHALVAIEVLSLSRALGDARIPGNIAAQANGLHPVIAGNYESSLTEADLATLRIYESQDKAGESAIRLSLYQLAIRCLLSCKAELEDAATSVKPPSGMRKETFRMLAHACLVRIPRIEHRVTQGLEEVLGALRANEDLSQQVELRGIRRDVEILIRDLADARKGLRISRKFGSADGRDFPPDLRCHRWLRRTLRVGKSTLPGHPLTNSLLYSREGYAGSWDLRDSGVTNLIVPSEGIDSLMKDLIGGKLFGHKLSAVYSGKAMAVWDAAVLVGNSGLLAASGLAIADPASSVATSAICIVCSVLLGAFELLAFGKLIHDLGHWIPWVWNLEDRVRKTSKSKGKEI